MGAGAYQRGSNLIRQQIEDDGKATRGLRGQLTALENKLDLVERKLSAANERIQLLEHQNGRLKIVVDGRRAQTQRLKQQLKKTFSDASQWLLALSQQTRAHKKLSAIVKVAMTPDGYREARETAAGMYPDLFTTGREIEMLNLNALQIEILHLGNQVWSAKHRVDLEELARFGLIEIEEFADDYGDSFKVTVLEDKVDKFFSQPILI